MVALRLNFPRLVAAMLAAELVLLPGAQAQKLCYNKTTAAVSLRKKCKTPERQINLTKVGVAGPQGAAGPTGAAGVSGATGATGPAGSTGATGPGGAAGATGAAGTTGPAGTEGQLRIYGDGSAGAATISGSTNWTLNTPPADYNLYFTDFTVNAGQTLTVPSGTIIRCTRDFVVNGTINVDHYTEGGWLKLESALGGTLVAPAFAAAHRGHGVRAAGSGLLVPQATGVARGGIKGHGFALDRLSAASLVRPGPVGGGSGMGIAQYPNTFGRGGGTLTVLAMGEIRINSGGSINADGREGWVYDGLGGGGGGIIILASATSITNQGTLSAVGGSGGEAAETADYGGLSIGGGGGGGGGILNLIAPAIDISAGTEPVTGGAGGTELTTNQAFYAGGGGGGAGFGDGGEGGLVSGGTAQGGLAGAPGIVIQQLIDPTYVF